MTHFMNLPLVDLSSFFDFFSGMSRYKAFHERASSVDLFFLSSTFSRHVPLWRISWWTCLVEFSSFVQCFWKVWCILLLHANLYFSNSIYCLGAIISTKNTWPNRRLWYRFLVIERISAISRILQYAPGFWNGLLVWLLLSHEALLQSSQKNNQFIQVK